MKKLLLVLVAIFALSISASAEYVVVSLNSGRSIEGNVVSRTDTTLVVEPVYAASHSTITFRPEGVRSFTISHVGRFNVVDGKFVPDAKTQARMEKLRIEQEAHAKLVSERAANPNEVIGKAFKSTGGVCIGVGIPSLLVGTILVAYGNTGLVDVPKTQADVDKNVSKGKCATAGCVLLPMGAALTIVGIPLHVHGKRIMEMRINYTGNGAGVALNF